LFDFLDVLKVESVTSTELKLKWKGDLNSCPPEDYFVTINGNQIIRGKRIIAGKNWNPGQFSATLNLQNQQGLSQCFF
jgi:hypothetical protein